ncbi:MAG TPA: 23S rRNA (pseudouridine(1915)-N(3))-methyltransferase RlmH, partial [Candidatus Saccharimonadales bacterium]
MAIKIIAVGRRHENWIDEGVRRYETRLKQPFNTEWVLLPHSAREGLMARQDESERILLKLKPDDFVLLLDERGKMIDSPALSQKLLEPLERSRQVVLIIGGAYGVDESVHRRADFVWSLSPLVFPHQL